MSERTIKHLEDLVDIKNNEIERLQDIIYEQERKLELNWVWSQHRTEKFDELDLPVPRLQIKCEQEYEDSWNSYIWTYEFVMKHLLGHIVYIPLGVTRVSGGQHSAPDQINDLPFRDGAHIRHDMEFLNLPAYSILENRIVQIQKR